MEGKSWRKSTFSGTTQGNCVELGEAPAAVLIRDSKDRGRGPVLRIAPRDWRRFTSAIKQA
jgi:hypothetical protein